MPAAYRIAELRGSNMHRPVSQPGLLEGLDCRIAYASRVSEAVETGRIRVERWNAFAGTRGSAGYRDPEAAAARAQGQVVQEDTATAPQAHAMVEGHRALMISTCCFLLPFSVVNLVQVARDPLGRRSGGRLRPEEAEVVAGHRDHQSGACPDPDSAVEVAN